MQTNLYTIYDTCAEIYNQPFPQGGDGEATRTFCDLVANAETSIAKHPDHYNLVRIGTWDNKKATLRPTDREVVITGLEALALIRKVDRHQLDAFAADVAEGETEQ